MRRPTRGGAAIQLLGATLFLLLLVGALGLTESRRALAIRTEAQAALRAALRSAAASPAPAESFDWYLTQNLGDQPFTARLSRLGPGEPDPLTGAPLERPLLTGELWAPYQVNWLGRGTAFQMHLAEHLWQEE